MNNTKHNGVKLGLYDTQWMNCVNDQQVLAWDTSKEDAVHRAVALAEKYCIENAKEAIAAVEKAEPVAWQFYEGGKWWNGDDRIKNHRKNTEDAGIPTRDLFAMDVRTK